MVLTNCMHLKNAKDLFLDMYNMNALNVFICSYESFPNNYLKEIQFHRLFQI